MKSGKAIGFIMYYKGGIYFESQDKKSNSICADNVPDFRSSSYGWIN